MPIATTPPSVQIKITLPTRLQKYVKNKADRYGITVSTYIKHLVLDDVKEMEMQVFKMTEKTETVLQDALKSHAQKKTHKIENIDDFLDSL